MFKDTLLSTAMKSRDFAAMNKKVLQAVRQKLNLQDDTWEIADNVLALPLGTGGVGHRLEAKVIHSAQGIPYATVQLKPLGVSEHGQYPTWTIEQRVQGHDGNVLFVSYRRPNHWLRKKLTLNEDFCPEGVAVRVGECLLLENIVEVIGCATGLVS